MVRRLWNKSSGQSNDDGSQRRETEAALVVHGGGGTPAEGVAAQGAWCRLFAEEGVVAQGRWLRETLSVVHEGGSTPAEGAAAQGAWCRLFTEEGVVAQGRRRREMVAAVREGGSMPAEGAVAQDRLRKEMVVVIKPVTAGRGREAMEQEMTEERNRTVATGRVLYEIRHHASADLPSDTSPPSVASSSSGGFLSYLSLRGVVHFKERWYQYRRSRAVNKKVSLIVSSGGEHVAVAVGNQISIFHKDDDYMNPCGVYTCSYYPLCVYAIEIHGCHHFMNMEREIACISDKHVVFHSGVWLETWDILGMIDDLSTLYVIRTNGEEILRRTRSQLKLSAPIIALICL
ncbi:hypothetical protein ZIOFF_070922 [Zingiber officinale]|uniref:Uncharacterized protein n=1 Tax=Zingiber officinale TaxID=94328 RepID=A0A8J5EQ70_ZINOF|nr:hypothetical protein ZIOFF_070922 [Zingiber officinale]